MKEKLISNLRNSLTILTSEAKEEEIRKIENQINQKLEGGTSEEEAIKSLGEVDEIVKEIYFSHGIDASKITKRKGFFYGKLEELFESIHNVVDAMSKNTFQENVKIIVDLLVLIVIICAIKIPFLLIENIGDGILEVLGNNTVNSIWGLAIDFAYIIVAIMVFMNIFTKWFHNIKSKPQAKKEESSKVEMPQKKIEGKELESVSLTDKVEKQ